MANDPAVPIVFSRLQTEEGRRPLAYNDATGKTVSCKPGGNLSIGYGVNLETGLDDTEMDWLLTKRLGDVATVVAGFWWYPPLPPGVASVILDVGYNDGVTALLHFPKMLAAAGAKDWPTMAAELLNSDAARELPDRYNALAQIILQGV